MNNDKGSNNKWESKVNCKKSVKGSVINSESPSDSLDNSFPDIRDGRKKISNNCCPPEGYLTSWEYIAYESGCYYY